MKQLNAGWYLRRKTDSLFMRVLGLLMGSNFTPFMWTTVSRTTYVPSRYDKDLDWGTPDWCVRHRVELQHEQTHIAQFKAWGFLTFALLYVGPSPFLWMTAGAMDVVHWCSGTPGNDLLTVVLASFYIVAGLTTPLSVGLALGRWRIEREAYLVQLRAGESMEVTLDLLQHGYLYPWPRSWMRTWFVARLKADGT